MRESPTLAFLVVLIGAVAAVGFGCRGNKADGQLCSEHAECKSERCATFDEARGGKRCATNCARDADCAGGEVCFAGVDACAKKKGVAVGARCTEHDQCDRGVCAGIEDAERGYEAGVCSQLCGSDSDCTAPLRCQEQVHKAGPLMRSIRYCAGRGPAAP